MNSLCALGLNDTYATPRNILEPDMEPAKLGTWEMCVGTGAKRDETARVPMTKNIPNGFFGYSTSGKKSGASRNASATFVGW